MPVYSMTGYASVQQSIGPASASSSGNGIQQATDAERLGLEIRSVNSRFLDLTLRLPDELRSQEPALRELLSAGLKRGKVELRITLEKTGAKGIEAPTTHLLKQIHALETQVRSVLPNARELSVADVMRLAGEQQRIDPESGPLLLQLARIALEELRTARGQEGQRLTDMLLDRTHQLRQLSHQAQPLVPKLVAQQRQKFLDRWREAMSLTEGSALPETAQDRALSEATAFAIRIDVAEEISRLTSHLDEVERLLHQGGELGKRLDFLIQEMHREANTLGSKSAALELTRISVDMKVLIEQMREQVQNIE